MNTPQRLNAVLDYIEANMTSEIDLNRLAEIACQSPYDFQRMFNLLAGMSIVEYIRKRRLSLAGLDIRQTDDKIIDIASKYGYESPVSFARAFQAFHGMSPTEARKSDVSLNLFHKRVFQITITEVMQMLRKDKIVVKGKEYDASYFGEVDISAWSDNIKREFWRLEGAYDDFVNLPRSGDALPFNNYPPIDVQVGQMFVIDYTRKDGTVERTYYIADGTTYGDTECTTHVIVDIMPALRVDKIGVNGKEYDASYFGEADISSWTDFIKREFWRLEGAYDDFVDLPRSGNGLPFNNYPPFGIKVGDILVIDYTGKDGSVERQYLIADGSVWGGRNSTPEVIIDIMPALRVDKITVSGKEYDASYFGEVDISSWSNWSKREFWRLEGAYDDFINLPRTGDMLPFNNYPPFGIKAGDMLVIDYTGKDGSVKRQYYIADGTVCDTMNCTCEVVPEE